MAAPGIKQKMEKFTEKIIPVNFFLFLHPHVASDTSADNKRLLHVNFILPQQIQYVPVIFNCLGFDAAAIKFAPPPLCGSPDKDFKF